MAAAPHLASSTALNDDDDDELGLSLHRARVDTTDEMVVAQELESLVQPLVTHGPRSRRSMSTATRHKQASINRMRSGPHGAHRAAATASAAGGNAASPTLAAIAVPQVPVGDRRRANTALSGLASPRPRGSSDIAALADDSAARRTPLTPLDDSREDLQHLVRNVSAASFAELHDHMQALQADMDTFAECYICGEFGKCAPFTCCKTPRHLSCEMAYAKANPLHWRLATATVREEDGSKAFRKLPRPQSEAEYAAQLRDAGDELYQLLRCSVCSKPLAAVRATGAFAPLEWHRICALAEEAEQRDELSMRGAHPLSMARGPMQRLAVLLAYDDVCSCLRGQVIWVFGCVALAALLLFIMASLGGSETFGGLGGQAAFAGGLSVALSGLCWSFTYCTLMNRVRQQAAAELHEEEATIGSSSSHAANQPSSSSSSAAASGRGGNDDDEAASTATPHDSCATSLLGESDPLSPAASASSSSSAVLHPSIAASRSHVHVGVVSVPSPLFQATTTAASTAASTTGTAPPSFQMTPWAQPTASRSLGAAALRSSSRDLTALASRSGAQG